MARIARIVIPEVPHHGEIGDSHPFFLDLCRCWRCHFVMARIARIVIPEVPHHVTHRGNNGQDVFFVNDGRAMYLDLLRRYCEASGLEMVGYCLMTNHVHLIARPSSEQSLARAIGRTHFLYTQCINRLHGRSGHLWQNRFGK